MVSGLIALMEYEGPECTKPFNLGNPRESTILELAEAVIQVSGSKSSIVRHPLPQDDPKQRCPDISRAREILGWGPRTALMDGLRKTFEYFRARVA
jgi:UDP-glucuronate decarboxylase